MKKALFVLLLSLFLLGAVFSGCRLKDEPPKEPVAPNNRVRAYDVPQGVTRYEECEVRVGDKRLPVYSVQVNVSQTWSGSKYQRRTNGACLLELDGQAEITVKPQVTIDYTSVVRPLSAKITAIADIANNELKMTFKSAGEYVLEINGDPYNAIHFFVSEYDDKGVTAYEGYDNIVIFEAGLHTAANDSRINAANNNAIKVASNTLIYLADGAVVRGRFEAVNAQNIAVVGRGIIDGSEFVRDSSKGLVTVPIIFDDCSNVMLADFSILDPAGWAVSLYFNVDVSVNSVKIITSRSNGDGISVQSCKNVTVSDCFVRTWDDSLVVKNYPRWENRSVHGATENITFKNCTLWTDLAQSMEIGYETVGVKLQNVTFENITVLHAMHLAVISIHNANNADIKDITFKNITVEDGKKAAEGVGLVDIRVLYSSTWSDQHTSPTALGNVTNVTVDNLKVFSAKKFTAYLGGCADVRKGFESEHFVSDVTIKNVSLAGKRLAYDDCDVKITDAKYLVDFDFEQETDKEVTGAEFLFTKSDEQLSKYANVCEVEIK